MEDPPRWSCNGFVIETSIEHDTTVGCGRERRKPQVDVKTSRIGPWQQQRRPEAPPVAIGCSMSALHEPTHVDVTFIEKGAGSNAIRTLFTAPVASQPTPSIRCCDLLLSTSLLILSLSALSSASCSCKASSSKCSWYQAGPYEHHEQVKRFRVLRKERKRRKKQKAGEKLMTVNNIPPKHFGQ